MVIDAKISVTLENYIRVYLMCIEFYVKSQQVKPQVIILTLLVESLFILDVFTVKFDKHKIEHPLHISLRL